MWHIFYTKHELYFFYFFFISSLIFKKRFLSKLKDTVSVSDKLGYIYWFAVLTTISCGFATGVYTTVKNRREMIENCQNKYRLYEEFWRRNSIGVPVDEIPWLANGDNRTDPIDIIFSRDTLHGLAEVNDLMYRIDFLDRILT